MKIIDFIKMAFLNLKKRRLRTILNVLAISIGTMLILVMIGLGMGTQNLLYSELKKYDLLNQIYVSPLEEVQNVQISVGSSRGENKKDFKKIITDKDLERMKDINGVEEVTGDVKLMIDEAKVENKGTFFTAFFCHGSKF
ncbi:MAG: hypothetical protein CBR30_06025 [Dictyoglomus sp. NZ13-RE01]|nr:MAG: hypothetical protein CBR30_06025 [Dictyoglomus sp. NZ13-RE01]